MSSKAVIEARSRRARRAGNVKIEQQWFIEEVRRRTDLTLKQRVTIAVAFLQDRIVQNISVPVVKQVIGGRTRVVKRSKPGEFPRADTTQLMKSIFWDVQEPISGMISGFVGTPIDYGLELELRKNRSFLVRTLNEEEENILKIVGGTQLY